MLVPRLRPFARILTAGLLLVPLSACTSLGSTAPDLPPGAYRMAVIGDLPYSKKDLKAMPDWIDQINKAKPVVTFHLGDLKEGSDDCMKDYYRTIRREFDRVEGALVYTPGDNDWADCHDKKAGAHDPLDRLALVREVFHPEPGRTLGKAPLTVTSYADCGLPENVTFARGPVRFVVVHLVGSGDGLDPWTGLGETAPTSAQVAEERARVDGAVKAIHDAFTAASRDQAKAVVVLTQADLFRDEVRVASFRPVVEALISGDAAFAGQVVLVNGDTHGFIDGDHPLAAGSPWLAHYGVSGSSDLSRIVVEGDKNADKGWVRLSADPSRPEPVSWKLVPY